MESSSGQRWSESTNAFYTSVLLSMPSGKAWICHLELTDYCPCHSSCHGVCMIVKGTLMGLKVRFWEIGKSLSRKKPSSDKSRARLE